MTVPTFPTLTGLAYPVRRRPMWHTLAQQSVSGVDSRQQLWTYPRYSYSLQVNVLKSDGAADWQTMLGFFNSVAGAALPWHYNDPYDKTVTLQTLGTGDGSTRAFPFVRALGGFVEPVQDVTAVSAVTVDGTPDTNYTITADSQFGFKYSLLFDGGHAPANGKLVKASFTYNWACRFNADQADFDNFAYNYWSLGKIDFTSVKVFSA